MRFRQWMNENKELSKKRLDMLVERFSVQELIEYRDNCARDRQIVTNIVMVLALVCFGIMLIACIMEEVSLITDQECNLYFGYFFGLTMGLLLFACPSGSYERKLTREIEKKCLRELEGKECIQSEK